MILFKSNKAVFTDVKREFYIEWFMIKTHPIRFLLYLEWISLAIAALSEIIRFPIHQSPRLLLFNLIILVLFGLMGLKLPKKKFINRTIYVALEFFLICLSFYVDRIRSPILFHVIFAIRNSLIFKQKVSLLISGLTFFLLPLISNRRLSNIPFPFQDELAEQFRLFFLTAGILFGLFLIFLQLLVNAVLSDRESKAQLALANNKLRQYALKIEDIATLKERNRIAQEIHDSLGHYLTVLNINLEAAWKLSQRNPQEASIFLADAKKMGSTALDEVRKSVATLRFESWQNQSLKEALTTLTTDFYKSTGILPQCKIKIDFPLPAQMKASIYRIVQEALTNICKYAQATEVTINIQTQENLSLMVQDNGKGFNLNEQPKGFGLQSMEERALALDGWLKIETSLDRGCCIMAELPLPDNNRTEQW